MNALPQPTRRTLSVDDYHRMGEAGIFARDERVELIEGEIITMAPIGNEHANLTSLLTGALFRAADDVARVWTQNPIRLSDLSEPQPDIALLAPRADDYRDGLPVPEDILLLIEIAHSSLAFDRDRKMPLYGRSGIGESWLIDVAGRAITRYEQPWSEGYRRSSPLEVARSVALPIAGCSADLSGLFG